MKIIFLDFDGVMDTAYYDMVLVSKGLQEVDEYGVLFDPACVRNLETIIRKTKSGYCCNFFLEIPNVL